MVIFLCTAATNLDFFLAVGKRFEMIEYSMLHYFKLFACRIFFIARIFPLSHLSGI